MAVQINVAANQAALVASIQAGVQAYNQKFANSNSINLNINAKAFSQPLGRITGDVKDFEAALAASNARVIAFGASTAVLGGVIRSFKELAAVTIDVEKNLADINRVFGLTTSQLQKFSTDLFNVSKQTASSFDDASKAALEFSRQGLKAEDTLQRTKDALTLTRLAGISTANAVDALTSTVNGFAATGISTTQILNKLVAVEQDYAVGAGDLAEALSRTGQAAQEAGVSLDQLNALVTAAQQSTARGGAVIGNALKTIFTRLQRTETLDQLEAFNIAVRDVQGNILPAVTILQNFAGAYKNLADAQKAQLSEQVAGVYQVNILKAVVNDLNNAQGVYAGALQRGASATNEAEVATAKLNRTLDALLSQTATSAQQLANNIGKVTFEPLARYGTEQLKSLVESMNEILEGEGVGSTFANGLLKGIRNILAGPGAIAAFFTLFKLIQNSFTYLSQALPQIAGITTETQNRKNIEQSILQIMQQQGPLSQALAGTMGNQAAQAQLLLQLARQQTAEYQQQSALAKQLAVQLSGQGVKVAGSRGLQVTRAGGYVPPATRMAEMVGAQAGGYSPGKVVASPVGGVMNTAEDVKYIPGFAQPFINPPANSNAGRAHRQNAINKTGVDPYMAIGFIPNFAKNKPSQFNVGRDFEKSVGLDIGVPPKHNAPIDFDYVLNKPVDKNFNPSLYKKNSFADAHSGYGHKSFENISKIINHFDQNYFSYFQKQGSKTKRLKINDKSSLISTVDMLGDLLIRPYYTEIIGEGSDKPETQQTSKISSLNTTAQATLLNGISDKDKKSILNRKITMLFAQDKVYGSGFIPNFAPPTSAMRIPWFKKFANPAYDNIQPTLGISKASDVDTFRTPQFRSKAFEKAATNGDPNIFGPLYEDFGRKALQLVNQSNIFGELIRGSRITPKAIPGQEPIDAGIELPDGTIIPWDFKGFGKNNLSGGSIAKHMTDKYNRVLKTDPEQAAKIKEAIMIFNEPGHENQLPSEFGKNFIQLAGTSYSQMLKNAPNLVKELSNETNMLLNRYVKDPQFLKMNAAGGFIPNFANKSIADHKSIRAIYDLYIGGKKINDRNGTLDDLLKIADPNNKQFKQLKTKGTRWTVQDIKGLPISEGVYAKGFIPNFAYKQAVMGLEESMSGNKAIFDTKPFPHIRNSSQPTFSSAIADHGGLSNALNDSMRGQKAAGLMSGGFIPNFVNFGPSYPYLPSNASSVSSNYYPSGNPNKPQAVSPTYQAPAAATNIKFKQEDIDKAIQDFINSVQSADKQLSLFDSIFGGRNKVIKSELVKLENNLSKNGISGTKLQEAMDQAAKKIKTEQSKLGQALEKSSTTLAIAGPLIAGQLEQIAYGNKDRTELTSGERIGKSVLSSGLTAVSTGASIGAAFGPWGSAIGAAAGAAVGLAQSLGAASLSADEYTKIADENKSKTQQNISAAQSYIDTLKTLETSTDPEIIKKASNSLADNFNNIKDVELQKIFRETGTDVKKLTDNLSTYETKRLKIQKDAEEDARAAQAGEAKTAKDYAKLGYKAKTYKGAGFASDTVALQVNEETNKQIIADYEQTFSDLSSLSDQAIQQFANLVRQEKGKIKFDPQVITNFLKNQNIDETIAQTLAERFDIFEDSSNIIGNYIIDNFVNLFDESKRKIKSATKKNQDAAILTNNFLIFKKELTDRLSDGLITATDAIKKFEFETSMVNLISNKLKEINDSIFSSISNNLTELGGILVKASQLEYGKEYQTNQLSLLRKQTTESTRLKNIESQASYLQQSRESIFGTGGITRSPKNQQVITEFLSKSLNYARNDFETFAGSLGLSQEAALNLAKTLESNQKAFKDRLTASNYELQLKNKEFDLTELSNKINYETGLKQLELEKEKLKITYAQRDATLQLRKDTDAFKTSSNQALELQKIQIGSEFRYLGLGKTQTFTAQQSDQKLIFDQEQKIAERQAVFDARRSIIEIATQEANTKAQEANTDAIISLIETIAREKIAQGESIMTKPNATQQDIDEAGRIQDLGSEIFRNTTRLRKAYSERRNNLSYGQLSNYGVKDTMSIQEAIAQLESSKTGKDKSTINAIDNTIQDLNNASNTIGSNATIYAAKVAQAKADFEQSSGFVNNMKIGFQELPKKSDELVDQLGRNLPAMFGDGLVDGIKAAIRESNNLGEALMGIASKFLDEISTTLMRSAIYGMLGSIGIPNLPIGGKQRGGIIRAQSGMYISGTGSGDKYPALLENGEYVLNRKAVMAMGGPSELDKLNFSMAPRFASGGSFSNQFEDLASMEANMTTSGLEESKLYNELRDVKRQEAEAARQKKRARRQQMAGIIGSLAGAAVALGLSAGVKKLNQPPKADGGYAATSAGQLEIGASGDAGPSPEGLSIVENQAVFATSRPKFGGRQVGGLIGSRLSDTIPGYATGGLFETPMVKRYAIGGGASGSSFGGSAASNNMINNNTNANNSFSFNTTVSRDNKIEIGANTTSYAQQDIELSQNLNSKIYETVLETIRNEKRFGGSLAGVRNR